jgi:RNA polymerase sigma-70 factor (ECF subfamily)
VSEPGTADRGRAATASRHLSEDQRQRLTDLYLSNFPHVFRLCRRMLRNPDDAADAAHDVFLRAIGSSQLPPAGTDVRPWLLTVARNYCLDVLRRRQRLGRVLVTLSGDRDAAADLETPVLDRQLVAAIFDQLRERERKALWQSAVERRSLSAIAYDLRLSYMATGQLLHRARKHAAMLAKRLAVIFGLLELGRAVRRARLAGSRLLSQVRQPSLNFSLSAPHALAVAAIAAVPIVLAPVPSSSSAHAAPSTPPSISALPGLTPLTPNAGIPDPRDLPGASGVLKQVTPLVSPVAVPTLPPVSVPQASPVGSAVNTLQQPVPTLPVPTGSATDVVSALLPPRHL